MHAYFWVSFTIIHWFITELRSYLFCGSITSFWMTRISSKVNHQFIVDEHLCSVRSLSSSSSFSVKYLILHDQFAVEETIKCVVNSGWCRAPDTVASDCGWREANMYGNLRRKGRNLLFCIVTVLRQNPKWDGECSRKAVRHDGGTGFRHSVDSLFSFPGFVQPLRFWLTEWYVLDLSLG